MAKVKTHHKPVNYKYHPPTPIIIDLTDETGFKLRIKAAKYIERNITTTGAERGSKEEQGFGALAEIVIRHQLDLPDIKGKSHPVGYDILLPSGIKLDVKCRGGALPFRESYESDDGIPREAKHNFFARQLYDERLDTDIYLLTHLETPKDRALPGTKRQKKWKLYACGWVSKERVLRGGVYLPRGSLTEQGKTWFTYRGQEIEFYNKNLNGLNTLKDIFTITHKDLLDDQRKKGGLNLTSVDAVRIANDLIGRGLLEKRHLDFIKGKLELRIEGKPILHPNQYHHLLQWLNEQGQIKDGVIKKAMKILPKKDFEGI